MSSSDSSERRTLVKDAVALGLPEPQARTTTTVKLAKYVSARRSGILDATSASPLVSPSTTPQRDQLPPQHRTVSPQTLPGVVTTPIEFLNALAQRFDSQSQQCIVSAKLGQLVSAIPELVGTFETIQHLQDDRLSSVISSVFFDDDDRKMLGKQAHRVIAAAYTADTHAMNNPLVLLHQQQTLLVKVLHEMNLARQQALERARSMRLPMQNETALLDRNAAIAKLYQIEEDKLQYIYTTITQNTISGSEMFREAARALSAQ